MRASVLIRRLLPTALAFLLLALFAEAEEPCMTIQSVSYVELCPDGTTQIYVSIVTDGCHIYAKFDDCAGNYHEWWFDVLRPAGPGTGDRKLDAALGEVRGEFMAMRARPRRTDKDVHAFLDKAIRRLARQTGSGKGKIKFNAATKLETAEFLQRIRNTQEK